MNLVPVKTAWSGQSDRMIKRQQFNNFSQNSQYHLKDVYIEKKINKTNKQWIL